MRPNMRLLVSLTVLTMIFAAFWATEAVAQGFGPWGSNSGQPAFEAFTSPDFPGDFGATTDGPWNASQQWTEGIALFEAFARENSDGSPSNPIISDDGSLGGTSLFEDWGVGESNTLWGFVPPGSTGGSSDSGLIVPPLW